MYSSGIHVLYNIFIVKFRYKMHWLVDCGQSLFCSKICKREYLSSEVVRVARGRVVGEGGEGNTNKKRDCNGFIQHFGRLALWWRTNGWSGWRSSVINSSSTSLGDPPRALNKSSSSRPATQSAENVCYRSNIFVLGKTKTTASLLYLQNLKRMRYLIYSKKQKSNCSKFSLRDPHVMFNSKV